MPRTQSRGAEAPVVSIPVVRPVVSEEILTIQQVAERLQMGVPTVRELLRSRNKRPLPHLKAGKFLRFKWSLIERWLDESASGRAA